MVKKLIIVFMMYSTIYSYDIFDRECVYCHKMLSISLKDSFFKYLKRYSSEENVKLVMYYYLKEPTVNLSVMPKEYIKIFGIKERSNLSDKELKKAIDIYWDRYKVFGKLK